MLKTLRSLGRNCKTAFFCALVFIFGGFSPVLASAENSTQVDLNTYQAELERIAGGVERLAAHPEEEQQLRDSLPDKWVISDQGTTYEVSTDRIAKELEAWQRDPHEKAHLDSVLRRLRGMQAEANGFAGGAQTSLNARHKLDEILSRREFRRAREFVWLQKLLDRIANWLERHQGRRRSTGRVNFSPWIGRVLVWTIIIAICGALAYVLWKWITRTQENLELNLSGGEQFHKVSREWVADALAAARRGDYRSAIRCGYWAAVIRLEELGRWTPNRTLTPREYLRMLPADHFQRSPLADLTQRFELTWYGYAVATARDFDQVTQQLEKLGCLVPSAATTQKS